MRKVLIGLTVASVVLLAILWNMREEPVLKLASIIQTHDRIVYTLAYSPCGRILASGSTDGPIKLWDTTSWSLIRSLEGHRDSVRCIAFAPCGRVLASSALDGTVRLWNLEDGTATKIIQSEVDGLWSLAFCSKGEILAFAACNRYDRSRMCEIRLADARSGVVSCVLHSCGPCVYSLSSSPDGDILASAGPGADTELWDIAKRKRIRSISIESIGADHVTFLPDGKTLATVRQDSGDKNIRLWDLTTGKLSYILTADLGNINAMACSPSGEFLAVGAGSPRHPREKSRIWIWSLADRSLVTTSDARRTFPYSVAFSPDGSFLSAGWQDGTIMNWKIDRTNMQPKKK